MSGEQHAGADPWREPRTGNYAGTERDGRWWKRARQDGLFVKGNGHYWLEDDALCFKRLLLKTPIRIPYTAMTGARIGAWHGGTWLAGRPIVKIAWRGADGAALGTGIGMGRRADAEALVAELERRMGR